MHCCGAFTKRGLRDGQIAQCECSQLPAPDMRASATGCRPFAVPPQCRTDLTRARRRSIHHLPLQRENGAACLQSRQHFICPFQFRLCRGQRGATDGKLRRMNSGHRPHPKITASANLANVKIEVAEVGKGAGKADRDQTARGRSNSQPRGNQIQRASVWIDPSAAE